MGALVAMDMPAPDNFACQLSRSAVAVVVHGPQAQRDVSDLIAFPRHRSTESVALKSPRHDFLTILLGVLAPLPGSENILRCCQPLRPRPK